MFASKNQASQKPTALGVMLQASVEGATIPVTFGMAKVAPLLIWMQNLRQGDSGKKGKKAGKKGAPPSYVANADLLVSSNPILNILRAWNNNQERYDLDFLSQTFTPGAGTRTLTISDSKFYSVIAVTVTENYDVTFNDYGGPVSDHRTGSFEVPCFNSFFIGPDPSSPNSFDRRPYTYRWNPTLGPNVYLEDEESRFDSIFNGKTVTVYYAATTSLGSPLSRLRLTIEPQLGDGSEFSGSGFPEQQVIYDMFAGVGSPDLDLGGSAMAPKINLEVQGKYGVYPSGDADFVDMILDIFMSGAMQAGYSSSKALGGLQHGVSCHDYPLILQQRFISQNADLACGPLTIPNPLNVGDFIVFFVVYDSAVVPDPPSDSSGLSYTAVRAANFASAGWSYGIFHRQILVDEPAGVTIDLTPYTNIAQQYGLTVVRGDDLGIETATVNIVTSNPVPGSTWPVQGSIETTNDGGSDALILAFIAVLSVHGKVVYPDPSANEWQPISTEGVGPGLMEIFARRVTQPGTYSLTGLSLFEPNEYNVVMISFKSKEPRGVARPFGNIIDRESLELCRRQCRAYGLYGSLAMLSQRAASDWLTDLCEAANIAPFWSGFELHFFPLAEASAVGNGAIYISPTAAGPLATINAKTGLLLPSPGEPPVSVERATSPDLPPNIMQYQIPARSSDYNPVVVKQPVAGAVANHGPRLDDVKTLDCVTTVVVARALASIKGRRILLNHNTPKGKLTANYQMLEPGDLVILDEPLMGLDVAPVRMTTIRHLEDDTLEYESDPFVYGKSSPEGLPASDPVGSGTDRNSDPGSVNPPIIFQPVPRLLENQNQPQVWLVVSGENIHYGGCVAYISTNGGVGYKAIGAIKGKAVTGYASADWPASADPDSTNSLLVDVSESRGEVDSMSEQDEDNFVLPFYIDGGDGPIIYSVNGSVVASLQAAAVDGVDVANPVTIYSVDGEDVAGTDGIDPAIKYELGAYGTAELTDQYQYEFPVGDAVTDPPEPPDFQKPANANSNLAWDDVNQRLVFVKAITGGGSSAVLGIVDLRLGYREITVTMRVSGNILASTLLANENYIFLCASTGVNVHWDAFLWDGTVVISSGPGWAACTAYGVGERIAGLTSDGVFIFECTSAGTSGFTEPTWSLSGGIDTNDCPLHPPGSGPSWGPVNSYMPTPGVGSACLVGDCVVWTGSTGTVYVLEAASSGVYPVCPRSLSGLTVAASGVATHYGGFFTASQMASDGVYAWVLNGGGLSPGAAYLMMVDISALSGSEWAVGNGVATELFGLEYDSGLLFYWQRDDDGSSVRQWDIGGDADTGVTFMAGSSLGLGPVRGGILPCGFNLLDAATLVADQVLSPSVNFKPTLLGINGAATIQYDPTNNHYWLISSDNYVSLGIPDLPAFTHLRRAVFGAPFPGLGVAHPAGARFCLLDPLGTGILKLNLDPRWIEKEILFKLCAYNEFDTQLQALSDATAYPFVPQRQGGSPSYSQTPSEALSQPVVGLDDYYVILMSQVTEAFETNQANYNARVFPVPDPGGTPVVYYITISDPAYTGEPIGSPVLESFCEDSDSKVGVAGYIYIGSILVTHAGGPTTVTPGGWPQ